MTKKTEIQNINTYENRSLMKIKILLSILAFGLILNAFSQKPTMEFTFTAENNGQYVPMDSLIIENLTQGGDTTFYAPDTVFVLDYVTSIGNNETIHTDKFGKNTISVSQNYPNPFKGKTKINLYLPEKDNIEITVRDILGRELAHYKNTLNSGNHSFAFYSGNEKYYLLTVTGKQTCKTIKMLNVNNNTTYGGKCKIVYCGYEDKKIVFKSQKAITNFVFSLGDSLQFIAFTDVEVTQMSETPLNSQNYTFQFEDWDPCPGMSTVTDIDGNIYNTVQIGSQCWMKKKLKTTAYRNGTAIPNVADTSAWSNLTTGAYVWYDNDISWKDSYGALYNWFAVDDDNGLCPTGWHIPNESDWTVLGNFIGGFGWPHANELRSCREVNSPYGGYCYTSSHPRWAPNNYSPNHGTDYWGFSVLPGGWRITDGTFGLHTSRGFFWTSTPTPDYPTDAWYYDFSYYIGYVIVYHADKHSGMSVRCIRD